MNHRDAILAAAAGVFAQHGFRGSTTRRIAEAMLREDSGSGGKDCVSVIHGQGN